MRMQPKRLAIHDLRLEQSSKLRSLFETICFGIHATLGSMFITKYIVIVYTSSMYKNASNTTINSFFTFRVIVQA